MTNINKFSFALRKGFNSLGQPSEIFQNSEGELSVNLCYFTFTQRTNTEVTLNDPNTIIIGEDNIIHRLETLQKNKANPATIELYKQAQNAFKMIREDGMSLDEANQVLRSKAQNFFQTYIADEKITQTYVPAFREFIANIPDTSGNDLRRPRALKELDKKIGQEVEIPHDRIRQAWGLD